MDNYLYPVSTATDSHSLTHSFTRSCFGRIFFFCRFTIFKPHMRFVGVTVCLTTLIWKILSCHFSNSLRFFLLMLIHQFCMLLNFFLLLVLFIMIKMSYENCDVCFCLAHTLIFSLSNFVSFFFLVLLDILWYADFAYNHVDTAWPRWF